MSRKVKIYRNPNPGCANDPPAGVWCPKRPQDKVDGILFPLQYCRRCQMHRAEDGYQVFCKHTFHTLPNLEKELKSE